MAGAVHNDSLVISKTRAAFIKAGEISSNYEREFADL